jgi:alkylation response protein AidB-like acyl-CoA dehydrogenase
MLLTETQAAIREAVRAYAQERLRPNSAAFEAAGAYPDGLFAELAELGLMGMTAPEEVGGAGADFVSYALALIELAAGDGALSTILSIQNSLIVAGLLQKGTEAQKARFLPALVSGRMIGAFALTEADAGSDASAIRTRARRVEGGWKISGAKQFITSGRIAGLVIAFVVTDPDAGKRGISAFLVPTDRPGYSVDKVEHKLGLGA